MTSDQPITKSYCKEGGGWGGGEDDGYRLIGLVLTRDRNI